MKLNPPEQKALLENAHCHGAVTRRMARERAVELATTDGRSEQGASKADWEQAKRELADGPSAPASTSGRTHAPAKPTINLKTMKKNESIVAIYPTHTAAETAVKELEQSGFDLKKLSIVGRGTHTDEQVVGYYNAGERMMHWGKFGAFWGWIWGLLFGSAFFMIPGVGPLMVAGPLVGWIVGALEGAAVVGGLSALGAGLFSLGIPKDSVLQYELALKTDKFLLIIHGSEAETRHAKEVLDRTGPETLQQHQ